VDLPALGFGMGDVVLKELLDDLGLLPTVSRGADYFVIAVGQEQRRESLRLVHRLRDAGFSVDHGLREAGVGKQMKAAAASGARRVVIIGPDEVAAGVVVVRVLETGEETRVQPASLFQPPGS
jgi:histidyl-tRNA synthetase